MRILLSKPKYVGDALLLTPTVAALRARYPRAEIWVLVRQGSEGILRGCPAIDRIVTVSAAPIGERRSRLNWLYDIRLMLALRRRRFDYWFELGDVHRARWFALVCGARHVYSTRPRTPLGWFWRLPFHGLSRYEWFGRHRVLKDYRSVTEFLELPDETPLPLIFERDRAVPWPPGDALTDFAVIHPGTRDRGKHWPIERWREVGRYLLTRFAHVVISVGPLPEEQEEARWLARELGPRALSMGGATTLPQLAFMLHRASLFVGIDTAAMHLAAACQTPIVALFGPSMESEWHPWRAPYRIVAPAEGTPAEEIPVRGGEPRRMEDIAVADVTAACEEMLASARAAGRGKAH